MGRFLQTDPIGTKDDSNLYGYAQRDPINRIDPDGNRDIFVGGAADRATAIVKDYARNFAAAHPTRDVRYQGWVNASGLIKLINTTPRGEPVNIVGHSYGAHTAVMAAAHADRPIDLLVTVDPVGRSAAGNPASNVGTWINVTAAPTTRNISDTIAELGGKPPNIETWRATEQYSADTNHGDLSGLLEQTTETGATIRQRVEQSIEDTQLGRNQGWSIEGEWVIGRRCISRLQCE